MTTTTATIEITSADGTAMSGHFAEPAGAASLIGVVVIHELFGVDPDIQSVANGLAEAGHLALAPEFYHRSAASGRWLPRDAEGRAEGFSLLHRINRDDGMTDVAAAVRTLQERAGIDEVALLGFSAGGHLAYLAACLLPITRTAVLYGGWLPTTDIPLSRPEPTLALTPGITGKLLYVIGEKDTIIDAAQRDQIAAALSSAGIDHEIVTQPEAAHAFFWPDTPAYDETARKDTWRRVLDFLG